MLHFVCQRRKWQKGKTISEVSKDGKRLSYVLEDELHELPGVPVKQWKVQDETAIPALIYTMKLVDSPKYGKDCIVLIPPPDVDCGFTDLRLHAGNKAKDTKGCPLPGMELDKNDDIVGGTSAPALKAIRDIAVPALKRGEECLWEVRNPPGYNGPPQQEAKPTDSMDREP